MAPILGKLPSASLVGFRVQGPRDAENTLHSPKLTWKPIWPPFKRTVVFIGPFLGFHVSFREGRPYGLRGGDIGVMLGFMV